MNAFIARKYDPFELSSLFVIIVADDWDIAKQIAKRKLYCDVVELECFGGCGVNEAIVVGIDIDNCDLERVEYE